MKFFIYDNVNNEVMLNEEEILLVKEFSSLMNIERNKTKTDKTGKKRELAFKELKFIYLFFDWGSPYFQYSEQDRHKEALSDSGLTSEEYNNPVFKEACKKYDELQNSSKIGKLLKASLNTVDKITNYLNNINLEERDPLTGKPIFKAKDILAEISSASKVIDAIKALEISFKKDLEPENALRGNVSQGLFD